MRRRHRERRSRVPLAIAAVGLFFVFVWYGNELFIRYESPGASRSVGKPSHGKLINGRRLPSEGVNFETYSRLGSSLGRTCVHHDVRRAVLKAYTLMLDEEPKFDFVFGETGWCSGGSFYPHETHQNGLSVDFMVPVRKDGKPAVLPHDVFHEFGYGIEFNGDGVYGDYVIDFEVMAEHLLALRKAAKKFGLEIDRVIFTPELRKKLFQSRAGRRVRHRIHFKKGAANVRHDEHYHVDFAIVRDDDQARSSGRRSGVRLGGDAE